MDDDPLSSGARYGDYLHDGRVLYEALTATEHYRDALTTIETSNRAGLAHLALYVAADAAATRGEQQHSGQVWLRLEARDRQPRRRRGARRHRGHARHVVADRSTTGRRP